MAKKCIVIGLNYEDKGSWILKSSIKCAEDFIETLKQYYCFCDGDITFVTKDPIYCILGYEALQKVYWLLQIKETIHFLYKEHLVWKCRLNCCYWSIYPIIKTTELGCKPMRGLQIWLILTANLVLQTKFFLIYYCEKNIATFLYNYASFSPQ